MNYQRCTQTNIKAKLKVSWNNEKACYLLYTDNKPFSFILLFSFSCERTALFGINNNLKNYPICFQYIILSDKWGLVNYLVFISLLYRPIKQHYLLLKNLVRE